jgi:L-cysteine S-thiosulfotransferase
MKGAAAALVLLAGAASAGDERLSGTAFISPETRAMQADDTANPGMLAVLEGARLWEEPAGASGRTCAGCHGDASESMRGVAARYPSFDEESGTAVDLTARVNLCRTRHQDADPLPPEDSGLLALTTLVAHQSRGQPIAPDPDPRLQPWRDLGATLFMTRMGQLNFSCANCHDDHAGRRLASSLIPQGHATGYPIYRLEWQSMGSLQRRFRNCLVGVRAEPFAYGSRELIALELFLADRAAGLSIETPAVRP